MRMYDDDIDLIDQVQRDFETIIGRRGGKGTSQEMVHGADELVRAADALTKAEPKAGAGPSSVGDAHLDRVATALEDIKHMVGALTSRPSMPKRAVAWVQENPWRAGTILLALGGAVGLYLHYVPKRKKR